jgi:DNA-binding FrmR family transcriptional regulator
LGDAASEVTPPPDVERTRSANTLGGSADLTEERTMELPAEVIEDVRRRLHRVTGQLAGIERMLDEGRECRDVVTQVSAATRALEQAGFKLVAAGLTYCLANPEEAAEAGYPLEAVEKMFLKLA